MTPRPPAFETAEARGAVAVWATLRSSDQRLLRLSEERNPGRQLLNRPFCGAYGETNRRNSEQRRIQ